MSAMTKQPLALRLADEFDNGDWIASTSQWRGEAANELRRLNAQNESLILAMGYAAAASQSAKFGAES